MSFAEFIKGSKHFAPSYFFDDLVARCIQNCDCIASAFQDVEVNKNTPLELDQFQEVLDQLTVTIRGEADIEKEESLAAGIRLAPIFDILDVRSTGSVSIGQLIAALQCGSPGVALKPSPEDSVGNQWTRFQRSMWHRGVFPI